MTDRVLAQAASGSISWWGLAASLVLVAISVAVSLWGRLGLERSMLWASARALAQLLAVGGVLAFLLAPGRSVAWGFAWVVFMVVVAAVTVRARASDVPGVLGLALISIGLSVAVGLGALLGLGVFPTEGRTVVPLAGMMVGNALAATVVAAQRILAELADKRAEVEARLALGLAWRDAARPHVRSALRTAITPQVERTKAVGLVALPGAMTGLILAGVDPLVAVRVQAAVMFLILGGVAVSAVVVATGLTRRCFTADHRLRPLRRQAV